MISKKLLLSGLLLSFLFLPAKSQISEGGIPPSFNDPVALRSLPDELDVKVNINQSRLRWENEMASKDGTPLKVAEIVPLALDIKSTGEWRFLSDSTLIWQKSITVKDALGILISYKDFYIPRGGKLFIYNKDKSHVLGAYTHETNPKGGAFATEAIWGDSFTFEYVSSKESSEAPCIAIESLGYMFERSILDDDMSKKTPMINTPHPEGRGLCRINVNCIDGINWQKQKRGVVLYFVKLYDGWYACSGSLVNNTNNDGKPYVLTASHCFNYDPNWETLITYFNHEFPDCENLNVMPDYKSITGATPLAYIPLDRGSDTFLFELKESIPNEWKPFYNGWDRRSIPANNGVVIHHPNKDVKKIITYNRKLKDATHGGATNAHWEVIYDGRSVTEKGSSGSPIFNTDGLIVGTLTGGFTYCDKPYASDFYGKLWYAWDQFNQDLVFEQQLKVFLDPANKGVETLLGYDPNGGSGIEEEIEQEIQRDIIVFPNPVEDQLHVNTNSIIRKIQIFTIDGKLIANITGSSGSTATINTSEFLKGIYTIKVHTDTNQLTEKFIKK